MELLVENTTIPILEEWISRWQFLSDYREEMGTTVEWNYTPLYEVEQWVKLNGNIGEYRQSIENRETMGMNVYSSNQASSEELPPSISLSSVYKTVDFMLPFTDEFLLYVYIDKKLPSAVRLEMYDRLGRVIDEWDVRESGTEPVYHALHLGGAFSPISSESPELSIVGEHPIIIEAMNKINSLPFLRILGILRNSYQEKRPDPGDAIASVDWSEMRDLVFNEENASRYDEVVRELPSSLELDLQGHDANTVNDMTEIIRVLSILPDFRTRPISLLLLSKVVLTGDSDPSSDLIGLSVSTLERTDIVRYTHATHVHDRIEYEHTSAVRYLIECLDFQVSNVKPEQLPWIARMMLGLGPMFDHNHYNLTHTLDNIPLYILLLVEMLAWIQNGGYIIPEKDEYPDIYKALAATMGTYYLSICVKCLSRILEANLHPSWSHLIRSRSIADILPASKNERTRLEAFIQATSRYTHKKTLYRCFPSDYIPRISSKSM